MAERKRKLSVRKLESALELITCAQCRYYLPADSKRGYCLKRVMPTTRDYTCPQKKAGFPVTELTPEQKAKLLEKYVSFEVYAKSVQETLKTLKEIVALVFEDGERYGNRKVVIKTVKRQTLDTKRAREILSEIGKLEECIRETEQRYIRVIDLKGDER